MKCPTCGKEMTAQPDFQDDRKVEYVCAYCWFKHMCEAPMPHIPYGFTGDYEAAILASQESEYDI